MKCRLIILSLLIFCTCKFPNKGGESGGSPIRPWKGNPAYWEYKGQPVLLLGATDNDNLFQNQNIESHLDSLKAIGGNYIRNTMSDRDTGDIRAFAALPDGRYDLRKWNDSYWECFENLLKLTHERDIIVQIEIWDRFDHSRVPWLSDPYHPANNINYTYQEAGLDSLYPLHPGQNAQPFFYTVPNLKSNKVLLQYQNAFVKKLLSISLNYRNVLYCIDNETNGAEEWAVYWAGFIHENSEGKEIYITQMWDTWDVKTDIHKRTLDHPERYGFIDISQNSQITGQLNWDNAQYIFDYIRDHPRPVNSTKVYGSDKGPWLNRGINTQHAVETFCRNITGGYASVRFHRPPSGLGLSPISMNCIKTVRKIEEYVKLWEITPRMHLLSDRQENQAYLAAAEGEKYLVYFTHGGRLSLDLTSSPGSFNVHWITTNDAEWLAEDRISGGKIIELVCPEEKSCFAVLIKL